MNTPTRSLNRSGRFAHGGREIRLLLLVAGIGQYTPLIFAAKGDVYIDPKTGVRAVDKSPDDARGSGTRSQKTGNGLPPGTESIWTSIGKARAKAKAKRLEEARVANDEGVKAPYQYDWKKAVGFLKEAAKKDPDSPVIKKNLAYAQTKLAHETESIAAAEALAAKQKSEAAAKQKLEAAAKRQTELEEQKREKIAAEKMKASAGKITQSLAALPSGAPGFDGRNTGGSPGGGGNGGVVVSTSAASVAGSVTSPVAQASADPQVVNAANLNSGLPREVDACITEVFSSAPLGVNDRVHKGFQAVMHGDRAAAKAWFQDALNRDPNNPELQSLVLVVDSAVPSLPVSAPGTARGAPASPGATAPARANRDPVASAVPPAPPATLPTIDRTLLQKLNEVLNRKLPPAHHVPAGGAVRG